jgi:hypothetical protein
MDMNAGMAALTIGQRISYTRRGMIHHGEIVSVEPNAPFSRVAYVVRADEHGGRCDLVLPKAIVEVASTR